MFNTNPSKVDVNQKQTLKFSPEIAPPKRPKKSSNLRVSKCSKKKEITTTPSIISLESPSHPPPNTCVASIVAAHATTGGTTPAPSPWKWRWRWLVALQKIESPRLVGWPGARFKRPPCATGRNDGTIGFDEWPGKNHLRNQFGYHKLFAWFYDNFRILRIFFFISFQSWWVELVLSCKPLPWSIQMAGSRVASTPSFWRIRRAKLMSTMHTRLESTQSMRLYMSSESESR